MSPDPAARIAVCPLSRLAETIEGTGADHVVTLMRRNEPALPTLGVRQHLRLDVSDITEPRDGFTLGAAAHVEELLRFATAWDRRVPLLIHCYAGVSRSTAAAFVVACALQPSTPEDVLSRDLRERSPTATPNRRLVLLGDEVLSRSGRMVRAIEAIGRGAECFEGTPFMLDCVVQTEKIVRA